MFSLQTRSKMRNTDFRYTFSLLNTDHVKLNKNWNYRNVISPFYRIYLIDDGFGSLGDKDSDHILEKGYIYLIPSFTICNHYCPSFLSQYYIHILEESTDGNSLFFNHRQIQKVESTPEDYAKFKRILHLNPGRGFKGVDNPKEYEKEQTLLGFQERNNLIPLASYLETSGLILQLLSRFLKNPDLKIRDTPKIPSKILDSIQFIQTHLQSNITVESLAERASQNAEYFSRVFRQYTGEKPLNYVQRKRVERAQYLMITTKLSLAEIATETGFESLSYFSRIFKKTTEQTPSQYKRNNSII